MIKTVIEKIDELIIGNFTPLKNKNQIYHLFTYCLPYVVEDGMIYNRDYCCPFLTKRMEIRNNYEFWNTHLKNEEKIYFYNQKTNPISYKKIDLEKWETNKYNIKDIFESKINNN